MHKQRLVLHRASMRAYAEEMRSKGHVVSYIETPDHGDVLEAAVPHAVRRIHLADPVDDVLLRRTRRFAERRGVETHRS